MLNVVKQFALSHQNGLFINSCFAHCQTERQDTWFADNSPVLHNRVSTMSSLIFCFSIGIYRSSLHMPGIYHQTFLMSCLLFKSIPSQRTKHNDVCPGLSNNTFSIDISGALSISIFSQGLTWLEVVLLCKLQFSHTKNVNHE